MRENRTYPLSFLFILVTMCAVMLGMLANTARSLDVVAKAVASATVAGALVGMVLGVILGCYHLRRGRGILWGGLMGLIMGGSCSCFYFVDQEVFPKLVVSQIGGAVMILFLAAIFRYGIRNEAE
jgi:hypothetical protein